MNPEIEQLAREYSEKRYPVGSFPTYPIRSRSDIIAIAIDAYTAALSQPKQDEPIDWKSIWKEKITPDEFKWNEFRIGESGWMYFNLFNQMDLSESEFERKETPTCEAYRPIIKFIPKQDEAVEKLSKMLLRSEQRLLNIKTSLKQDFNIETDRDLINQMGINEIDKSKLFMWIRYQCEFSYAEALNQLK